VRRLFGGLGFDVEALPITVDWVWVGNVSGTGATIKARSTDAASATLRYSTDPGLAGYETVTGIEGNDDVYTFDLSGLSANTRYHGALAGSDVAFTFRTFPVGQASFTVAAGSCAGGSGGEFEVGVVANPPTFDRIVDHDPILFIHMGDRGYPDINTNSPSAFRTNYNNNMDMARQHTMHLAMPVAYHWSDHDFGTDNAIGTATSKPAAQSVYREHVPHWTLPDANAIYQKFTIGRVLFILLDVHSERSSNSATDNSSKTMLGATQKQWLKDTVSAATEKVIVIGLNTPWHSGNTLNPAWPQFSTERQELIDYFDAEGVTSKIIGLFGDHHRCMADDGTNSPGGIPVFGFAPMDGSVTTELGTYTEGSHFDSNQQYGTLAFVDSGSTITVTGKAWAVDGTSEDEIFSMDVAIAA
jgi:phosphodiesterase/alkaline phosphatase D-like protein